MRCALLYYLSRQRSAQPRSSAHQPVGPVTYVLYQATYTVHLLGIGSGHRQLIAVTCITEDA